MTPTAKKYLRGFFIGALIGVALVIVVFVLRVTYSFPARAADVQQSAVVTTASPAGLKGLQVRMWVNESVVESGEKIRLLVRFENGTDQPLQGLKIIDTQQPGFWYRPLKLRDSVLAKNGAVETEAVELAPSTNRGKFRITVRYQVTDQQGMVHEGSIASSPITLRDEARERRYLFIRRIVSFFTLPLFLGIAGIWFQRWQIARDEDSKTKAGTESRRQEIWKTILPQFYALSEEYYLPVVRSLRMIDQFRIEKPNKAPNDEEAKKMNRLLFEYLFLLLRMDLLRRKKGQLFFKSRGGEKVASLAWKVMILGSEAHIGRAYMDAALEKMTVDTTYKQFNFLLKESAALRDVEEKFRDWNLKAYENPDPKQDFYRYTHLAAIMQATIYFEANRPFDRDWYEEPTDFTLDEVKDEQYPAGHDKDIEKIKKALTAYRKEIKAYMDSFERPVA
ncbi:MAG TPA: hypothetical protein VIX90_16060 [Edaphobacter sp.]